MPDFVLFKSEIALKTENRQMAAKIARLEADNARLKAMVGEEITAIAAAVAVTGGAPTETFKAGNCTITMTAAKGAPIVPRASGVGVPRATVAANVGPQQGQTLRSVPAPAIVAGPGELATDAKQGVQEDSEDDSVLRFRMMDLG